MTRVTISIPKPLLERLDAAAAEAGLKRSQALHHATRAWLDRAEADEVRERLASYYAEHPEELSADAEGDSWGDYQRRQMEREYSDDEW